MNVEQHAPFIIIIIIRVINFMQGIYNYTWTKPRF
jgi:hypothetical protein